MFQTMAEQQEYSPEQIAAMKKKLASMNPEEIQELVKQQCIFCKIIAGEVPGYTVYEDDKVMAFLDIQPANPGHVIVVPKTHYSVLPQMPDDEVGYLFSVAKQLAGVIFDAVGAEGVSLVQRNGQVAGQIVPHVYIHIIPRTSKDKVKEEWEPLKMSEADFKKVQQTLSTKAKTIKIASPKTRVVEKIVEAPITKGKGGAKKTKPKKKQIKKVKRTP